MDLPLHRRARRFHRRSCVAQSHLGEDHCHGGEEDFFGYFSCKSTFSFVLVKLEKKACQASKQGEFWSAWWGRVFSHLLVDSRFYLWRFKVHFLISSIYEGRFPICFLFELLLMKVAFLFASYLSFYLWRLLFFCFLFELWYLLCKTRYDLPRGLFNTK